MAERETVELLGDWQAGDAQAAEALARKIYPELKRIAGRRLAAVGPVTLGATEVVNEAYIRLCAQNRVRFKNRHHFFAIAARLVRRVILDHARSRGRQRRGGGQAHRSLDSVILKVDGMNLDALALDEALDQLDAVDSRAARVVELRHFAGLNQEEIATVLDVGLATVGRSWRFARAWLRLRLGEAAS